MEFYIPEAEGFLKTLLEKVKMMINSNFSFLGSFYQPKAHYKMTNFRLFQTKKVCRQQFQIDENGRNLSKQVENTVGKGEIARNEQFLLFPQYFPTVFSKGLFPRGVKRCCCVGMG